MSDLIKRDDAILIMAKQMMYEANIEYPGTATDDIEDWKEIAEDMLSVVPPVDALEVGGEYRLDAFDIVFINYKSEDGATTFKAFRIARLNNE